MLFDWEIRRRLPPSPPAATGAPAVGAEVAAALTARGTDIILNIMKTLSKNGPHTISTHDMRFQFDRVLRAVKAGRSLTLTYRNKPLARIVPLRTEPEIAENDAIFRLHELAEPIGPLTNAEIDAAIYGT